MTDLVSSLMAKDHPWLAALGWLSALRTSGVYDWRSKPRDMSVRESPVPEASPGGGPDSWESWTVAGRVGGWH